MPYLSQDGRPLGNSVGESQIWRDEHAAARTHPQIWGTTPGILKGLKLSLIQNDPFDWGKTDYSLI